jgi:hypothetical protein
VDEIKQEWLKHREKLIKEGKLIEEPQDVREV